MESAIIIKIDYNSKRIKPEDIFSAMSLYISAHKKYGQLLATGLGLEIKFEFALADIKEGSIKSVLDTISGGIGQFLNNRSMDLISDLIHIDKLENPDEVEELIVRQEERLKKESNCISPHLGRAEFAEIISELSTANGLLEKGESVDITHSSNGEEKTYPINTNLRIFVSPDEMIKKGVVTQNISKDYLDIIKPVNFGYSQWFVRSRTIGKPFNAFMEDKEWLKRYQDGQIPVITAKYCMIALIRYEILKTQKKLEIRRAEIIKVLDVVSSDEVQNELF